MDISKVLGSAPLSFAFCPRVSCNKKCSQWQQHPDFNWAIKVSCHCTVPETVWYICTVCNKQRTSLVTEGQFKSHHRLRHHTAVKRKFKSASSCTVIADSQIQENILSFDNDNNYTTPTNEEHVQLTTRIEDGIFETDDGSFLLGVTNGVVESTSPLNDSSTNIIISSADYENMIDQYFDAKYVPFFKSKFSTNTGLTYLASLCDNSNDTDVTRVTELHFSLANLCFNISKK